MANFAVNTALEVVGDVEQPDPLSQASPVPYKSLQEQEGDNDIENQREFYTQVAYATQLKFSTQTKQTRRPLQEIKNSHRAKALQQQPNSDTRASFGEVRSRAKRRDSSLHLPNISTADFEALLARRVGPQVDVGIPINKEAENEAITQRIEALGRQHLSPSPSHDLTVARDRGGAEREGSLERPSVDTSRSEARSPKRAHVYDPDHPIQSVGDGSDMSLNDVPKDMRQKTKHLNSMMTDQAVRSCYEALEMTNGNLRAAIQFLEQNETHRLELNRKSIEAEAEPLPQLEDCDQTVSYQRDQICHGNDVQTRQQNIAVGKQNQLRSHKGVEGQNNEHLDIHSMAPQPPDVPPFANWRAALVNGRYLPRHRTQITKEQDLLLQADHSWQPPLVGQIHRPGSIPLDLLNAITGIADNRRDTETTQALWRDQPDQDAEDGFLNTGQTNASISQVQRLRPDDDSLSEEVGSEDWPASPPVMTHIRQETFLEERVASELTSPLTSSPPVPPHKRVQLPPDSSPLQRLLKPCRSSESPPARQQSTGSIVDFSPDRTQNPPHLSIAKLNSHQSDPAVVEDESEWCKDGIVSDIAKGRPKLPQHNLFGLGDEITLKMTVEDQNAGVSKPDTSRYDDNSQSSLQEQTQALHEDQVDVAQSKINTRSAGRVWRSKQSVQVKRTPYISKPALSATEKELPEASPPNSSPLCVPSTFDQEVIQRSMNDAKIHEKNFMQNQELTAEGKMFELNSSEDEKALASDSRRAKVKEGKKKMNGFPGCPPQASSFNCFSRTDCSKSPSENSEQGVDDQVTQYVERDLNMAEHVSTNEESSRGIQPRHKRAGEDFSEPLSFKRIKTSPLQREVREKLDLAFHHFRVPDPDLFFVQDRIHRERQMFYQSLKNHSSQGVPTSSCREVNLSRRATVYSELDADPRPATSSCGYSQDPSSTPATAMSAHRKSSAVSLKQTQPASTIRSSRKLIEDLFCTFQAIYPGYEGDLVQFQNTCHLISDLRTDDRAPHPSLWDDFVIRHYHDYQGYVQKAQTRRQSILPFVVYYEEVVEDAQVLQRVVRPDLIKLLSSSSRSPNLSKSRVCCPATWAANTLEKSDYVDLESSISNAEPSMTPSYKLASPLDQAIPKSPSKSPPQDEKMEYSQNSSVKLWLEKASGAESPVLGSPNSTAEATDVPMLDLNSAGENMDSAPVARATVSPKSEILAPKQNLTSIRDRSPAREEKTESSLKKTQLSSTRASIRAPPSSSETRASQRSPAPEQLFPRRDLWTHSQSMPTAARVSLAIKKQASHSSHEPEQTLVVESTSKTSIRKPTQRFKDLEKPKSVVQQFAENYAKLPSERPRPTRSTEDDVKRLISIFSQAVARKYGS